MIKVADNKMEATETTIRFMQRSEDAYPPFQHLSTDAGYDLAASKGETIPPNTRKTIKTDLGICIPQGFQGQLALRSKFAQENPVSIEAGIIDAEYVGEILANVHNHSTEKELIIAKGDYFFQIIFHYKPKVKLMGVQALPMTARGERGMGEKMNGKVDGTDPTDKKTDEKNSKEVKESSNNEMIKKEDN